jgi:uncharacterized membrane protein
MNFFDHGLLLVLERLSHFYIAYMKKMHVKKLDGTRHTREERVIVMNS